MTYTINAHNGFIEEIEVDTLQAAKDYADANAAYTQENISIDVDGEAVAIRRWWAGLSRREFCEELVERCHEKTLFIDDTVKITTAYLPTVDEMAIIIYEMNDDCWVITKDIKVSDILK